MDSCVGLCVGLCVGICVGLLVDRGVGKGDEKLMSTRQVPSNVTHSMPAKWKTQCSHCRVIIRPGDLIFKIPDGEGFNWCVDPLCNNAQTSLDFTESPYIIH